MALFFVIDFDPKTEAYGRYPEIFKTEDAADARAKYLAEANPGHRFMLAQYTFAYDCPVTVGAVRRIGA